MQRRHVGRLRQWRLFSRSLLLLSALALLALGVSACAAPRAQPFAYVWTDAQSLDTLIWHEQNGALSGQDTTLSFAATAFPTSTQPDVGTAAYTGTLSDSAVTITIGGMEQVTGTQSADSNQLSLSAVSPASGQLVRQTWVAVTANQQAALVQAFEAQEAARDWLGVVVLEARAETSWTDPNADALTTTQAQLAQHQAQLTAIQQAQDSTTRCTLAARSIPLAASWFALPFTISNSRLAALFVRFTPAWQAARRLAVPRVAGLALPWLLTAQDERHAIAPATTLAAHIQAVYTADAQSMQRFSQQSRHIDAQVTTLDAGCPPMPA